MIIMRTRVNTATGFGRLKAIRHRLLKINDGNIKLIFNYRKRRKDRCSIPVLLPFQRCLLINQEKKLVMPHFS